MRTELKMDGTDLYDLFRKMEEDHIILSFKGNITRDLLSSVYNIMESHLAQADDSTQRRKKFYNILVESLQNVFHHMQGLNSPGGESEAMFMVAFTKDDGYRIHTGNFIRSDEVQNLKERLESISRMNADELREHYRDKLAATELSERGGAGLGFIDMARKSGHKLDFHFREVEKGMHFFTFSVTVK